MRLLMTWLTERGRRFDERVGDRFAVAVALAVVGVLVRTVSPGANEHAEKFRVPSETEQTGRRERHEGCARGPMMAEVQASRHGIGTRGAPSTRLEPRGAALARSRLPFVTRLLPVTQSPTSPVGSLHRAFYIEPSSPRPAGAATTREVSDEHRELQPERAAPGETGDAIAERQAANRAVDDSRVKQELATSPSTYVPSTADHLDAATAALRVAVDRRDLDPDRLQEIGEAFAQFQAELEGARRTVPDR